MVTIVPDASQWIGVSKAFNQACVDTRQVNLMCLLLFSKDLFIAINNQLEPLNKNLLTGAVSFPR